MHLIWTAGFTAFALATGGLWTVLFMRLWTRPSLPRTVAINIAVLVSLAGVCAGAGEAYCYLFRIQSDACAFTLANQRWMDLHWGPLNTQGFRDRELVVDGTKGKRVLCVLGDSFAAGWGIADRAQRFGERLERRLGPAWRVLNMAKPGWDTAQELEALKACPVKPDVAVLQYFINDIDGAAARAGIRTRATKIAPPRGMGYLVDHSYLASEVYWALARRLHAEYHTEYYEAAIRRCYGDDAIWSDHRREIAAFAQYARANGIQCIVVVFPYLFRINQTAAICEKVSRAFAEERVSVLNLAPLLDGRDPRTLVCNPADGHPNAALHEEVATLLYEQLAKDGAVTRP